MHVKDVAAMKSFELKPVILLLNSFASAIRESVMSIFQQVGEGGRYRWRGGSQES